MINFYLEKKKKINVRNMDYVVLINLFKNLFNLLHEMLRQPQPLHVVDNAELYKFFIQGISGGNCINKQTCIWKYE